MTDEGKPLDSVVGSLIESARESERGFVLGLANRAKTDGGGELKVTFTEQLAPHDEWEAPTAFRNHTIEDAESLVAYALKYGDAGKSLVLFNDSAVVLSIDEQRERGKRELATLTFAYSPDWKAWGGKLTGDNIDHRMLLKFLILQQHNLTDPTILDRMRSIKATAQVKLDSDLRLEKEEAGVVFTATAGDDLVKFPRAFEINLPVLDKDVDAQPAWVQIPIRVEVVLPTEPKQPVFFQLLAPTLNAARRERINTEVAVIRQGLNGWTVVRGTHREAQRTLGKIN